MKVYIEEQKFSQPLVFVGLSIALIVSIFAVINDWQIIKELSTIKKIGALSGVIIVFLVILLFINLKLKTRIDENGINYQFYPYHQSYKLIPWIKISKLFIRNYDAISEYGGWGMKFNFFKKKGKALTTKGNIGLQLHLTNGKKLLIGTQKKEELQRVLNTYHHKIISNEK